MARSFSRILFLLLGLAGAAYSGYLIYQKQYFPINHSSFETTGSEQLYVSDLKALKSKSNGIELLMSYGAEHWSDWMRELTAGQLPDNVSIQFNTSPDQHTLSICNLPQSYIKQLPGVQFIDQEQVLAWGDQRWHFWQNDTYFAISDKAINPENTGQLTLPYHGNADFFFKAKDGVVEAIKLTEKVKFSAFMTHESPLKGRPINPFQLLSHCPLTAQKIRYYGSSRYRADAPVLQGSDQINSHAWIEDEIAYIAKDSFEVFIAKQSDEQQLKYLIQEDLAGSDQEVDMKPSIYSNNVEIIPFDVGWRWQNLCQDIKSEMHYFAMYDNYIFLSNNLQAMYWLLTNIQLGKTFDVLELRKKIPSRVNSLGIDRLNDDIMMTSKTWISGSKSINLSGTTRKTTVSNGSNLVSDFQDINLTKWLHVVEDSSQTYILSSNQQSMNSYTIDGQLIWDKKFDNSLTLAPIHVKYGQEDLDRILIVQGKSAKMISQDGQFFDGFILNAASEIKNIQSINSQKDGFIVQDNQGVTLFDASGQKVTVHQQAHIFNKAKRFNIQRFNENQDLLILYTEDSIYVINSVSEELLGQQKIELVEGVHTPSIIEHAGKYQTIAYHNGYLKINYFDQNGIDSLMLDGHIKGASATWVKSKNKWLLGLETFDQMMFYNTLGLKEFELRKPEPNVVFLDGDWTDHGVFPFLNKERKTVYFLDLYGNLLLRTPINYESLMAMSTHYILNKSQNRFHLYKVF